MKKIICVLLCVFTLLSAAAFPAAASADDGFAASLRAAGFPTSFVTKLSALHDKYPNWNFEPLFTGVSLDKAVANERTPHSQQLIQKTSSNSSKGYYCQCSSCYKNGSYVIQEGSTWVSASETAVKYYMNPLNFLDEKYIFQFETTAYSGEQTASGVETIIKNTWMYNSLITYKDSAGKTQTFKNSQYPNGVKYSQAILDAAKSSGMSAYYLASRIVQEVGGKTNSAGGASGTNSSYPGIYNYYNIGANTGALDGLKWAATKSQSGYSTNCNARLRKSPTTSSAHIVTVPEGTAVSILSTTGVQADGYKWYNVRVSVSSVSYTGYIRSDLVDYSDGDRYGRPWTNPYVSIVNGAKYIANNFSEDQNTGYLQKFNVNPQSDNMYSHEYMANVQAPSSEAGNTYKAYSGAGLLSGSKTFIIPVFEGMEDGITGFEVVGRGDGGKSLRLEWNAVDGADGYKLYDVTNGKNVLKDTVTESKVKFTDLTPAWEYDIKVIAYSDGGRQSSAVYRICAALAPVDEYAVKIEDGKITASWVEQASHGYYIQWSTDPSFAKNVSGKYIGGSWTTSTTISVSNPESYYVRIRAWKWYNDERIYSDFSPAAPAGFVVAGRGDGGKSLRLEWNAVDGAVKYEIYDVTNGKNILKDTVTESKVKFTDLTPAWEYDMKVIAYDEQGRKSSAVYRICAATPPVENLKLSETSAGEIKAVWDYAVCHGYYIQWASDESFTKNVGGTYISGTYTTSYTIKGVNPGNCYVRIRSWKNYDGGKIYSDFSSPVKL